MTTLATTSLRSSTLVVTRRALLRYLRTHSTGIFIAYRLVAAAVFLVLLLLD